MKRLRCSHWLAGMMLSLLAATAGADPSSTPAKTYVQNGDIEKGFDGWSFKSTSEVVQDLSDKQAHSGKNSLHVAVPDGVKGWFGFRQKLSIRGGGLNLAVSAFVKGQDVKGRAGIYVHAVDNHGKMIFEKTIEAGKGSFDWKELRYNFTLPDGTDHVDIGAAINGAGETWYDDFSVIMAGAAQAQTSSATMPKSTLPGDFRHTSREEILALKWDFSQRGRKLDLAGYVETFRDDFQTNSVTAEGGKGPWFAPVHSTFGAGKFMAPGDQPDPYFLTSDGLRIRSQRIKGKWYSGNIQTVDSKGNGFAQQYGYFEMTAKFPGGTGPWTAFWLLSQDGYRDPTKTRFEMDAIEWYGGDPGGHHTAIHLWPAKYPQPDAITKESGVGHIVRVEKEGLFSKVNWQDFHSYGVEITPDFLIVYMDRIELERLPTIPEMHTPMYMLVTNAVFDGKNQPDDAASPLDMIVRNVLAYQKKK